MPTWCRPEPRPPFRPQADCGVACVGAYCFGEPLRRSSPSHLSDRACADEAPQLAIKLPTAAVVLSPTSGESTHTRLSSALGAPQVHRMVGMTAASRARISRQCSSLSSISGTAARSLRNVAARCITRHFSPIDMRRRSAGAGRHV
jgi:hypothetical protein